LLRAAWSAINNNPPNQGIGDRRKAVFNARTNIKLYERPYVETEEIEANLSQRVHRGC